MGTHRYPTDGRTTIAGTAVSIAVFAFALAVVGSGFPIPHRKKALHIREQAVFSEEEPIQYPVPIFPEALQLLLQTDEGGRGLDIANNSLRRDPARLFHAGVVHLHSIDESDLVVIGVPPMSGGDDDWFWIVRSAQRSPEIILFVGASSLQLMASSTKGFQDVRAVWSGASETSTNIYKFNGKVYRLWKKKWTKNGR